MADGGEHAGPGASSEEAWRRETVTMLLAAIRMCTREDAAQVMSAELERIGAGMPGPAFLEEQIRARNTGTRGDRVMCRNAGEGMAAAAQASLCREGGCMVMCYIITKVTM